tara:strand:+ start:6515 stop:6928 length:414 start_codon:yes stop_codon:yes gene_type:complete
MSDSDGQLQNYSVDQAAGAVVLVLGAVASLLLVIWQSKCHCKMNLCYIFQCERRPPSEDEMKGLKDQFKKTEKKEDEILKKEKEILDEVIVPKGEKEKNLNDKKKKGKKDVVKPIVIQEDEENIIPNDENIIENNNP